MKEKLTPTEQVRRQRDARIVNLYDRYRPGSARQIECLLLISQKVGCGLTTIRTVLTRAGRI